MKCTEGGEQAQRWKGGLGALPYSTNVSWDEWKSVLAPSQKVMVPYVVQGGRGDGTVRQRGAALIYPTESQLVRAGRSPERPASPLAE